MRRDSYYWPPPDFGPEPPRRLWRSRVNLPAMLCGAVSGGLVMFVLVWLWLRSH